MSLQTIVFSVCDRLSIPRPSSIVSNADDSARLMLSLANEEGQELANRYQWQALTKEYSFTATGTTTQTTLTAITSSDFAKFIDDTMWNRSNLRHVRGSLGPVRWQRLKASNVTGPYPEFRVRGNYLLMIPSPTAGDVYFGEYLSKNWCQNSAGTSTYSEWNADTDTGILDEKLMELGLRWRWLAHKRLDYQEEFRLYTDRVNDAIARDGGRTTLNMGKPRGSWPLGPEGSWSIT